MKGHMGKGHLSQNRVRGSPGHKRLLESGTPGTLGCWAPLKLSCPLHPLNSTHSSLCDTVQGPLSWHRHGKAAMGAWRSPSGPAGWSRGNWGQHLRERVGRPLGMGISWGCA